MRDREAWADEIAAAAVTAAESGFPREADRIISYAAHHGLRPFELLAAGTRRTAVTAEPEPAQEGTPMLVTYVGPADQVTLAPAFGGARFVRGEQVEVPDDLGRALCRQPGFVPGRKRQRRTETPDQPARTEIPESADPSTETR